MPNFRRISYLCNIMKTPVNIFYQSDKAVFGETWRGNGAVATEPYSGFNLCHYTGDDPGHIALCLHWLADDFGISINNIVVPRQVHGTNIAVIAHGTDFSRDMIENSDAVICSSPDLLIGVNTADCIPVIIIDEDAGMIAAVHAGWRGAAAGIVQKTAAKMMALGAHSLCAYIGSGICCDCFEVGDEVAGRFPESFVRRSTGTKPHVDLSGYVAACLKDAGVGHIEMPGKCTRCNSLQYFSARATGISSGRNFTFAMLLR